MKIGGFDSIQLSVRSSSTILAHIQIVVEL